MSSSQNKKLMGPSAFPPDDFKMRGDPIKNTTLIKYYDFFQDQGTVEGTWYSGREYTFTKPKIQKSHALHYPDEYLIAHILNKYLATLQQETRIHVLTQPWRNHRTGYFNDLHFNSLILKTIEEESKNVDLILVPFLHKNHHPGIAIDLKNKVAIYIDTFGWPSTYLRHTGNLQELLEEKGFHFEGVKAKQQRGNSFDTSSCGPILTASMIKFIDEFVATKSISPDGFIAPRPLLATERMLQMKLNNAIALEDGLNVHEIMLADENLWRAFFAEAKSPGLDLQAKIIKAIQIQKTYIAQLKNDWPNDPMCVELVGFIREFQSSVTERIQENKLDGIQDLIAMNLNYFDPAIICVRNLVNAPDNPSKLLTDLTAIAPDEKNNQAWKENIHGNIKKFSTDHQLKLANHLMDFSIGLKQSDAKDKKDKQAAFQALVNRNENQLTLEDKNELFVFSKKLTQLNEHRNPLRDDLLGLPNTASWRVMAKNIRKEAYKQLLKKVSEEKDFNKKITQLIEARKISLFRDHRNNSIFSGAFWRTQTVKDIDGEIKKLRKIQNNQPPSPVEEKNPILDDVKIDFRIHTFGLHLRDIATAFAAKHFKRRKKGSDLNAWVVNHSEFDHFLAFIKNKKQQLTLDDTFNFQFVLRIRGDDSDDSPIGHFVFGEVLGTSNGLNFLIIDGEGATYPELLGKELWPDATRGYLYKHWQKNPVNFFKKINDAFSDVPGFHLITNLEMLQTEAYGCSYFSTFGCFELSSMRPDYMPKPDGGSYASIFEYMGAHAVPSLECKSKTNGHLSDTKGDPWKKMVSETLEKPVLDGGGRIPRDHHEFFTKSGTVLATLPDRMVRNQQIIGCKNDKKIDFKASSIGHYRGTYARAIFHHQPLNKKKQTLQASLKQHIKDKRNNRLQYKIERLKANIHSFYTTNELTSEAREASIQAYIFRSTG